MGLPEVLVDVRKWPGMYLTAVRYDAAVAFVQGYDAGMAGGLLIGFREWLIVTLGEGNNLAWPSLLQMLTKRTSAVVESTSDDKALIDFMFATLDKYLIERAEHGGMRRIYANYDSWLRRQEWYTPSSPDWMPPR